MTRERPENSTFGKISIIVLGGLLLYLFTGWIGNVNDAVVRAGINENNICSIKDDVTEIKDNVEYLRSKAEKE